MPKMKSNRGAVKRFSRTGSGKIKRNKAFASHILTKKTRKRKRGLRQATLVAPADKARVKSLIGSGP
ncbi:50S ribosomal protein L35 [candidate division KSB1 bacterium]|nr:50S ribosomal protein L35 [candidate division KSB1 bacterium]